MRKIETDMLHAFRLGRNFKSGNTSLNNTDHGQIVRLHGNPIAQLDGSTLYLTSAGWETTTTKSRLNAVLDYLIPGSRIFQRDFVWFITYHGLTVEFSEVEGQPIAV